MAEQHEKALVPQIRFTGFTDPWEQRKLGELFEEHSEKDRDDLPALTIIQGGGTVHRDESNRNLQFDRNSLSNYKVVDTGDFIVHLRSFEGGLEKATCCGLVSPAYHIFRGKNVDSDFYYLYFRSKRFIDADLKPHVYGIRDGRSIDIEGMKTIFIPWTNLAEQRRIGAFFDHLDSLITLHQRKYDKLCVLKKSMLDKMFPKGGSLYPEIRFAGFTDPWEQRKLGELCSFSKGCGYSKNNLRDQGTPIILYGRLYTNYETRIHSVDTFVDPLENSVYTEGGEVIVPASGETAEDISIASVVEKPGIILGGDLNIITPSAVVNPVFLALELSYGKPHFDLAKRAQGKSVVHIHNEDIANVFFDRPCIAEQRQIGAFFDRLDSLITLHQRKLELLRNIKKSMLDKMFV
ncbi:restriction endonuclease subunit S [Bifidobacterium adolescentis]|nr:restriction endonuclease subunit S [Bifidobacterium adolescentis]MDB1366429.1 restriction endonuclease subunit S [Bifidobacterium adolescentis]MDB1368923.1 restriction endonuclease subunit S [Bifidobacterium adolescentis]MDB1372624.1 restriction endonuclease subunit S [Bifidobacterium adolescentis]MDB1374499.1 restriction endonuclease subunit S [Bifidobacterium adolescentis]